MRGSYGKFILPAAVAAASLIALTGAADGAGSRRHDGYRGAPGMHAGYRGGGHVRGGHLRYLPTLPVLVEPGRPSVGGGTTAVGVPGVPDPVPQAPAGSYAVTGYEGYGLPTSLPSTGTYVGGIAAVASVGNGNYFAVDGSVDLSAPGRTLPPRAKVIDVGRGVENAACDMQHGVCIIRP